MTTKRTEDQKIFQDGVPVILGGNEYKIKPLKLRAEREWREKLSELLAKIAPYSKVSSDDEKAFGGAIKTLLVGFPDEVVDLFFLYAKDLDRDKLEEEATGAEVAEGFKVVIALAFPLPQALTGAMERLSQ